MCLVTKAIFCPDSTSTPFLCLTVIRAVLLFLKHSIAATVYYITQNICMLFSNFLYYQENCFTLTVYDVPVSSTLQSATVLSSGSVKMQQR